MIEKILERLEEEALQAEKDMGLSDTFAEAERSGGRWAAYEKAYKIVQEVAKDGGWIPCSSGQMPTECEEVDVTIEEIDGDVYTSTSWLQEGVWVVKKTALQPRVIAWKPKSAPYQKGE